MDREMSERMISEESSEVGCHVERPSEDRQPRYGICRPEEGKEEMKTVLETVRLRREGH